MTDLEKNLTKWKKYHEAGAHCVATLREVNELLSRIAELENASTTTTKEREKDNE